MHKTCPECGIILPSNHTAKYCGPNCFQGNMEKYWNKPYIRKRWSGPVKLVETKAEQHKMLFDVEKDLKKLERRVVFDRLDLETI